LRYLATRIRINSGKAEEAKPMKENAFCMTNSEISHENPVRRLVENRKRLINGFLAGDENRFPEKNALALDAYFQESFEKSEIGPKLDITKNPYAVIALGGYGRKEQCLFSDVDLLFLFEKKVPDKAEDLIREMVFPLWDIGLDVGHAVRSIKDCITLARQDISVLTSMLDARFICGMSNVYLNLMDQIRQKIIEGRAGQIIRQLVESNRERHAYFGDSTYRLEPNLKEGLGGLRDYHTLLWIGRIRSNIKEPRDLEYEGYLSHDEYLCLEKALSFIFEVRSRLHHMAGRKSDRLHFEYQIKMAGALNFGVENGQKPVEQFLGKLHAEMDFIKQQYQIFLHELGYHKPNSRKKKETKQTRVPELHINRGMITFASPEKIVQNPFLLLEIFRESDRHQLPLSAEAKRLVREFAPRIHQLVNQLNFQGPESSSRMVRLLERILVNGDPEGNTLDEMLETGILTQLIPEFQKIRNRIQFDEYHLYPVDKHSLHTVKMLQRWGKQEGKHNEPLCMEIYADLADPRLLHWGALLHDIGKGDAAEDHAKSGEALVPGILARFGFNDKDIETVSFLVREHLFLIKIATRRDINDERTCISCAERIKDISWLKMLYLLTVADSASTGPNAWNEWTATLLRNLFIRVLNILEKGELASEAAVGQVEKKKEQIRNALKKGEDADSLMEIMSPRYLLYVAAGDIMEHIRLFEMIHDDDFVWEVKANPNSDTRTVTVCAKDAPGLFSKIAGTFTLNGIDILNAQVFTWRNNIALDIFEVKPPPDRLFERERWDRAKNDLQCIVDGCLDLATALKEKTTAYRSNVSPKGERPVRVHVDNESSSFFTIIEVFAYDYLGLLYDITDALFRLGLDVWVSKIATKVDQVVDVFYIRDFDGQKVDDPGQVEKIRAALLERVKKPEVRGQKTEVRDRKTEDG
jgi:[protein-PII] uridylyltransferase